VLLGVRAQAEAAPTISSAVVSNPTPIALAVVALRKLIERGASAVECKATADRVLLIKSTAALRAWRYYG
jgi:hypothetical protein